jgi:hypothetical protein
VALDPVRSASATKTGLGDLGLGDPNIPTCLRTKPRLRTPLEHRTDHRKVATLRALFVFQSLNHALNGLFTKSLINILFEARAFGTVRTT